MANRNGLNHKIRGQKGVGFNRALPAAFGFDRGYKATTSGFFSVPKLAGTILPAVFTLEFWTKPTNNLTAYTGYFCMLDTSSNIITGSTGASNRLQFAAPGAGILSPEVSLNINAWNHIVIRVNGPALTYSLVLDGNVANPYPRHISAPFTPAPLSTVRINNNNSASGSMPIDEFRLYDRLISDNEIITNYNSGAGNNASNTEGLIIWYKFEAFENLDFSISQDGSTMQTGIRDISGKNNHALINGAMDTNPTSPSYVLQPL